MKRAVSSLDFRQEHTTHLASLSHDLSPHQEMATSGGLVCLVRPALLLHVVCGSALPWKHWAARVGFLTRSHPGIPYKPPIDTLHCLDRQDERTLLRPSLPQLQGLV